MILLGSGEGGESRRSQGMNGVIRGGGQFAKKPVEVGAGVDAPAQAAAQQAVENGGALTGSRISNEHPVLFTERTGADGVLHAVVMYASTRRWGSPGESPGWRHRSSQKHWERLQEETNELKYYQKRSPRGISESMRAAM